MSQNGIEEEENEFKMAEVIELINTLQDAASLSNISPILLDLPQMVVVGEQSAGKSSVLETIVGKDFLPRGTGIVTRCPLVLQLIHHSEEYAEFLHDKNNKYSDFEDVKLEISKETERKAGRKKLICPNPINLKIYSPNVPHLTLIDLPGLTKVPVDDQPENIETIVREMIISYIKPENTLILAVTAATQDLANSDAIKLAQTVDPKGVRTIGVITKLDLMDPGTNARKVLENKVIPLKRGYVGVVNRSQEDIDNHKDIRVVRIKEKRFFSTQSAYRDMKNRMGSVYLTKMLSEQLCRHIHEKMPSMKAQVRKENTRVKQALDAMKAFEQQKDDSWQKPKIVEMIQKFSGEFEKNLQGQSTHVDNDTISGGAKINDCFYTEIYPLLSLRFSANKNELYNLWRNMVGYKNIMFFTQEAFDNVIQRHLLNYKEPLNTATISCSKLVKESVDDCLQKMKIYPFLQQEVSRLMTEELDRNEQKTMKELKYLIKAQKSFMNIYHPDFMKQPSLNKHSSEAQKQQQKKAVSNHDTESTSSIAGDDEYFPEDEIVIRRSEVARAVLNIHSALSIAKSFFFILTLNKLIWYKDEYDSRPRGSIPANQLEVIVCRGRPKIKKYIFQKLDSKKSESSRMVISFKNESDENLWMESFQQVGINVINEDGSAFYISGQESTDKIGFTQNSQKTDSVGETNVDENNSNDKDADEEGDPRCNFGNDPILEEVIVKLCSYTKIINETVRDLTPKYISYFLIHKTMKYAKLKLLSDIQSEDSTHLLEVGQEEMDKREEYMKLFEATERALKVMGEVNTGSISAKKKKNMKVNKKQDEEEENISD